MSGGAYIKTDNTKIYASALNAAILRALEAVGLDTERTAKENAPYDTGRLEASITHVINNAEKAAYIGSNVEYALYQELGTSRMKAANGGRGYLRPAVNDNRDRIKAIFLAALRG